MKRNELVWRELVDAAVITQHRRWPNVDDLAFEAGVAPATASYALKRLVEIGAIELHHAGFSVVNPRKVLTQMCAARSVVTDAFALVTLTPSERERVFSALGERVIAGGPRAAIELLGGDNTVSDYSEEIVYVRDSQSQEQVNNQITLIAPPRHAGVGRDRGNTMFVRADPRGARKWRQHSSFAQTYADLFATPGWQASEFLRALEQRYKKELAPLSTVR